MTRAARPSWLLFLLGLHFGTARIAEAHSDPVGDVYPWVVVVNGMFHVISFVGGPGSRESCRYRMIYTPEGRMVVPRHQLTDEASAKTFGDVRVGSFRNLDHGPYLDFAYTDMHSMWTPPDSPRRLELFEKVNGVATSELLPVDPGPIADLTESWISKTHVGILWDEMAPDPAAAQPKFLLHLTWLRRGDFSEPQTQDLGPCAAIYAMPVASNLVWVQGRLWVAWVRINPANGAPRPFETMLTSYDPIADRLETKALAGPSHWNCHLSLATTGGWLCTAWHCPMEDVYPGRAQIITVFEKLPGQASSKP